MENLQTDEQVEVDLDQTPHGIEPKLGVGAIAAARVEPSTTTLGGIHPSGFQFEQAGVPARF